MANPTNLQVSAAGIPLMHADGTLMKWCCCGLWPPAANCCYTAAFANMKGTFNSYRGGSLNGQHITLRAKPSFSPWWDDDQVSDHPLDPDADWHIYLTWGGTNWMMSIIPGGPTSSGCYVELEGPAVLGTIAGPYRYKGSSWCQDTGCADTASCSKMVAYPAVGYAWANVV